ncbi:Hypothetical protein POVR1_LOCUS63 [uncultured virus]|nr:Hypothetical protein POVR1_LOCUS63 [uncultured virus]
MDGTITVTVNIPIADLGTPKVVALLKHLEEFKTPNQQPLREELESDRMKRKVLEAKLQILNDQFKDHGAAFLVEIPGESIENLEKRVKQSVEWAQRKISEEEAQKSTSKGKSEAPESSGNSLIHAALQAAANHVASQINPQSSPQPCQSNTLNVNPSFASVATSLSSHVETFLQSVPKGRGLNQILKEQVVEAFLDSMFDEMCGDATHQSVNPRTFNANWLLDFDFSQSDVASINSSFNAVLSTVSEENKKTFLEMYDNILDCFLSSDDQMKKFLISLVKTAFKESNIQSQAKNTVDLLPKFLLGSEPPNQETIKKAVRVFFRTLKGFV